MEITIENSKEELNKPLIRRENKVIDFSINEQNKDKNEEEQV